MVSLEHKFGKLIDMAQKWSLERRRIDALPALINSVMAHQSLIMTD